MSSQEIALALQRARSVFERRPQSALHADAPATARWAGGTRVHSLHGSGASVPSDMPREFGGSGDQVSPGWLFRAGLGACSTTCIALVAAERGVALAQLEIETTSNSDARGLLGMNDQATAAPSATRDLGMHVRVAATACGEAELRSLVEEGLRRSPVYAALREAVPITVRVSVAAR
jgi:uncharacterized OsmC-like protein